MCEPVTITRSVSATRSSLRGGVGVGDASTDEIWAIVRFNGTLRGGHGHTASCAVASCGKAKESAPHRKSAARIREGVFISRPADSSTVCGGRLMACNESGKRQGIDVIYCFLRRIFWPAATKRSGPRTQPCSCRCGPRHSETESRTGFRQAKPARESTLATSGSRGPSGGITRRTADQVSAPRSLDRS